MFFLNLSALEFFALFSAVSGVVLTLYLLSRSRRKQIVSTLRFWVAADQPVPMKQRRRIQQPLSLLLQLLSLLLLLLAIAQLRLGSPDSSSRDHVLVLDTSSWMAAKSGNGTLLDEAKRKAYAYLKALPATDRVMVVRAEAVPMPVTGMESDRALAQRAVGESRPGAAALNLAQAFTFAEQTRRLNTRRPGEIVYIGSTRVSAQGVPEKAPDALRFIEVSARGENSGFTKIGLKRSAVDPARWQVFLSVRNYGSQPRRVPLAVHFGGAQVGSAVVSAEPGKPVETNFEFQTRAAGWVEARLLVQDAVSEDNRAILEIPALPVMKVVVYSTEPELLRPALQANPQIQAEFRTPGEYKPGDPEAILIFDRFVPRDLPRHPAIWIDPPDNRSTFAVRSRSGDGPVVRWRAEHDVAVGLRTKQLRLKDAKVFVTAKGDIAIAEVEAGPVIVARPETRSIALGFHPGTSEMRFDVATPLLLANILRWMKPDVFRHSEVHGTTVGSVSVALESGSDPAKVRVIGEDQQLPFTVHGRTVRFFAGTPGTVRVISGDREQVHSLALPEMPAGAWTPAGSLLRGLPGGFGGVTSRDIWQALAALGCLGLIVEWLMYGRARRARSISAQPVEGPVPMRQAS